MATFNITGGTGVAGARVQCLGGGAVQIATCDGSGNYTFTVADVTTYVLIADTKDVTGQFAGFIFPIQHQVSVNGGNVLNVNFNAISAKTSNAPPQQEF